MSYGRVARPAARARRWTKRATLRRYGGRATPALPTATQPLFAALDEPENPPRLTYPPRRNIIASIRGSERRVAGFKSESRPASDRNRWPASYWNAWPASSESASGPRSACQSGRAGCPPPAASSSTRRSRAASNSSNCPDPTDDEVRQPPSEAPKSGDFSEAISSSTSAGRVIPPLSQTRPIMSP